MAGGWPGLAKEATEICDKVGLPDMVKNKMTKKEIKDVLLVRWGGNPQKMPNCRD